MTSLLAAGLSFLLVSQSGPSRQVQELTEKLRSERIDEREEAARKLKALGKEAIFGLETAATDKDSEVASRAKHLLRVISIVERLGPELLKACPDIEERLARGNDHTWTEEFVELVRRRIGADRPLQALRLRDIEPLARGALRAAQGRYEKQRICLILVRGRILAAIPEIARLLEDEDAAVRQGALRAFAELKATEASDAIGGRLEDEDPGVRTQAAFTLAEIGAKEAVPRIVRLLKGEDWERTGAALALVALGASEGIPVLEEILKTRVVDVATAAARALTWVDRARYVPAVLPLLETGSSHVKIDVANLLAGLGAQESVPPLLLLLKGSDPYVRVNVASALADLGAREAVPEIIRLMANPESAVHREAFIKDLVRLGAREGVPAIEGCLQDRNHWVRSRAIRALKELQGKEAVPTLTACLKDENIYVRFEAARSLGLLGVPGSARMLIGFLEDRDDAIRLWAAGALGDMGAKEAIPSLIQRLQDDAEHVRAGAAEALGALGAEEPVAGFIKLGRQVEAVRMLGRLRAGSAVPALTRMLEDPDRRLRREAASSLCLMGAGEKAIPVLLEESGDLHVLNAVRRPEMWKRLRHLRPTDHPDRSTLREDMMHKARNEGVLLKWSWFLPDANCRPWELTAEGGRADWMARTRFLESLDDAFPRSPFEVILEADCVRVVRREAALAFWKSWWSERKR